MTAPLETPIEEPPQAGDAAAPASDVSTAAAAATPEQQAIAADADALAQSVEGDGTNAAPRTSLDNLKFAVLALVVLAAAVVAIGQLSGATTSEGSSDADAAALAVIAADIVTSAKDDGGALDAIGGYLPGTGMVLTVELASTGDGTTADWVSAHLGPFAETLAIMPVDESIIVTINEADRGSARVWSLPVSALSSSVRDWNQLVAPATFESNEVAIAVDATIDEAPIEVEPVEDEPVEESGPFAEVASGEEVSPEDAVIVETEPEPVIEDGPEPVVEADPEPVVETPVGGDGETVVVDLGGGGELVSAFTDGDNFAPIFGSWVLVDGVYSQTDATGYGYSAAYAGLVPDVYDVSVDMRAPNGDLNAGIIYGMPDRTRKHGGKVVDLTAESTYLRWGEYDAVSGDWSFIGGAPIDPGLAQDEWQNLKLEVRPEGTSVLLNDQFIATLDPVETGGQVALVVSVANVEFRDFFVTQPEDAAVVEVEVGDDGGTGGDYVVFDDELREWTLLSGSWTAAEGVLTQGNGQAYDQMVHFSNFEQDDYRVEVDLRAKEGSIFSGGLLFNIETFGQRPNSQLFDIVDDGQVLRWAGYDQNGVFSYVGGLRTSAGFDPDGWHTIAVEVRAGVASFYVDGEQVGVSDDVGNAGYVGLVTSLAAMEFRNFSVTTLG